MAFTILDCYPIADVNPIAYLTAVFPTLTGRVRLKDLLDLLPRRWKLRRDAAAAFAATLDQLAS